MATHSSTLAWKIPWTEEPGRLQSMGLLRVKPRLSDFTFTFHFHALEKEMATHSSVLAWRIPGLREPGVGCRLWGRTESDMTEATKQQQQTLLFLSQGGALGRGREVLKQQFPPSLYLTLPASPGPTCFYQFHFMNQDGNFLTWLSSREVGKIKTETFNKIAILPFK